MFKQPVTLELTTSGHYCVNILDTDITQSPCKNEILTDRAHGDSESHREHEQKKNTKYCSSFTNSLDMLQLTDFRSYSGVQGIMMMRSTKLETKCTANELTIKSGKDRE